MSIRVTRYDAAPPYVAARHNGVDCKRLQGLEAGPTDRFWTGLSIYEPGGEAEESPTAEETVYTLLDGELTVRAGGGEVVLHRWDSVHLPKGAVRSVKNESSAPAVLLVAIATPEATP